ncbi:MAG: hypothetical protein IKN42_08065 [Elusimicrobia bacterium]|nr:hypothetical protein [Elusimicrobiota bacterium]
MKNIVTPFFITLLLLLSVFSFAENIDTSKQKEETPIKIIDREYYQVQTKQYNKDYPIILYVVFKESTPLLDEIKKILKTEILTMTKTKKIEDDIIASAWFDDQVSDNLEKIELAKKYGAFVRIYDKKEKKAVGIVPFNEYLKYLKKKKEEDKKKDKANKI